MNIVNKIANAVRDSAERARSDAGFSGSWGDGGASHQEELLKHWLDGVSFAQTGETQVYKSLLKKLMNEEDSEYKKYIELKKKFEE